MAASKDNSEGPETERGVVRSNAVLARGCRMIVQVGRMLSKMGVPPGKEGMEVGVLLGN